MQSGAEEERASLLRSIHMKTVNKNSNQVCLYFKSQAVRAQGVFTGHVVKPFPLQTKNQRPREIKLQWMNRLTSLGLVDIGLHGSGIAL